MATDREMCLLVRGACVDGEKPQAGDHREPTKQIHRIEASILKV